MRFLKIVFSLIFIVEASLQANFLCTLLRNADYIHPLMTERILFIIFIYSENSFNQFHYRRLKVQLYN